MRLTRESNTLTQPRALATKDLDPLADLTSVDPRVDRETNPEASGYATLLAIHQGIEALRSHLALMHPPKIQAAKTAVINASGIWTLDSRFPIRCAAVQNLSGTVLVVASGPPQTQIPTQGDGTHAINPGGYTVVPIGSPSITIYGPPGSVANVDLLSEIIPLTGGGGTPLVKSFPFTLGALCSPVGASYMGLALVETSGVNTGVLAIRDGSVTGQIIGSLSVAAGGAYDFVFPSPVGTTGGIFVQQRSGTVTVAGSVRYA